MSEPNKALPDMAVVIARELARLDGYDMDDPHNGLHDLQWSGGAQPEPLGDAWCMDYLPKGESIAAAIRALAASEPGEAEPDAADLHAAKLDEVEAIFTAQQRRDYFLEARAAIERAEPVGFVTGDGFAALHQKAVPPPGSKLYAHPPTAATLSGHTLQQIAKCLRAYVVDDDTDGHELIRIVEAAATPDEYRRGYTDGAREALQRHHNCEPGTDTIAMQPEQVREALAFACEEIKRLAISGTNALQQAGVACDPPERTYGPILARIAALREPRA